jgi:SAM-dependent methyltransferase
MAETGYTLDNQWQAARERLTQLERHLDAATIRHLQRIGVGAGWCCLEVGGGGGSVARWLCGQVGTTGAVTATDLDTRFLDQIGAPNLTVWRHNLETDDLPAGAFDLVHTRIVIVHLRDRQRALARLAAAVKPGGWILLEEPDHVTTSADPEAAPAAQALFDRVVTTYLKAFRDRGQDVHVGHRLVGILRAAGFTELGGEGRAQVFQGGTSEAAFQRLTCLQLRDLILASGGVGEADFDRFMALLDDPGFAFRFFLVMSAWGRKPPGPAA